MYDYCHNKLSNSFHTVFKFNHEVQSASTFWISEIHFRSQFWPFQIDTDFFSGDHLGCLKITFDRFSGHFRLIGHLGSPKLTFDGISGHFRSIQNFNYFLKFLTKWPPAAILDGMTMSIIELVQYIWMSNACVKLNNVV